MLTTLKMNNSSCAHSLEIHAGKISLLCLTVAAVWLSLCYCLFNGPGGFFLPDQLSPGTLIAAQVITGCLFLSSVIDAIYYLYLFKQRSIRPSPPLPSLASSSQTSSSQTSISTSPISQTSHSIPVLDFSNKPIEKIISYGASALHNLTTLNNGYNLPIVEFLLSSRNSQHLFTREGIADQIQASTPIQPIQNFPYIVTRPFPVWLKNKNITSKQFVRSAVSNFFQGMRDSQKKPFNEATTLPGTIIFPMFPPATIAHTYLIFVEREENGIFHISLIDSLGAISTSNTYCQKDMREGVEEALRMHFGHGIDVHFHYGPNQNNLDLCAIHIQMNIDAAKHWILSTGRKVFEAIPTIFKKRSKGELLEHFSKDKEIARQFYHKYESRKAEWAKEDAFAFNDIQGNLL